MLLRRTEGEGEGKRRAKVEHYAGLTAVDTFSKKTTIVPMASKSSGDIVAALEKGFVAVGGEPKMLY